MNESREHTGDNDSSSQKANGKPSDDPLDPNFDPEELRRAMGTIKRTRAPSEAVLAAGRNVTPEEWAAAAARRAAQVAEYDRKQAAQAVAPPAPSDSEGKP